MVVEKGRDTGKLPTVGGFPSRTNSFGTCLRAARAETFASRTREDKTVLAIRWRRMFRRLSVFRFAGRARRCRFLRIRRARFSLLFCERAEETFHITFCLAVVAAAGALQRSA